MGPGDILLGLTLRWTSISSGGGGGWGGGRIAMISVALCYRNRIKFQACWRPVTRCVFTYLTKETKKIQLPEMQHIMHKGWGLRMETFKIT